MTRDRLIALYSAVIALTLHIWKSSLANRRMTKFEKALSIVLLKAAHTLVLPITPLVSHSIQHLDSACPVFRSFARNSVSKIVHPSSARPHSQARTHVLSALADTANVPFHVFTAHLRFTLPSFWRCHPRCSQHRPDHIFQDHGAWKTSKAMQTCISRFLENKLLTTSAMQY